MAKDIFLFYKDELSFKNKFFRLMNLLISKQSESRAESFLLLTIFYLQIISSFFSEQLGVFSSSNGKSDNILIFIGKVIRLKGLFENYYEYIIMIKYAIFIIILLEIFHFILSCFCISRKSYYSYNNMIINYYIKIFIYILYNIIYDICFSGFCLGNKEYNKNYNSIKCSSQKSISSFILILIFILINIFAYIFANIYYSDSFFLSSSYFAKMTCNYDTYWGFNCMIISLLLNQLDFLTKEVFFLYNMFVSILLFRYFVTHYLYYDKYINIYAGIFHLLYVWTNSYCLIFNYISFKEKGIVYLLTSIIICFFYFSIKNRIENSIFLDTSLYQIENKYYILFFFRRIIDIINNLEENNKDKALLSGIIRMHEIECPNNDCLTKAKNLNIYLPLSKKWNDSSKKRIEDEVFLKYFIVSIMTYLASIQDCSVDIYLNLSLYYLKVIGNYCQAIYYFKKSTELNFTLRDEYSFTRLGIMISTVLIEKLKPSNEQCSELENLDVSMYYKYDELSQNFLNEINNDVNLTLEFWKAFRVPLQEPTKKFDFNKIFELTDEISKTKKNVEIMWNKLIQIYDGVNDFFELYVEYVEQINDDDLKKRDLESLRRKNENFGEVINGNFNSILFNKDTGIIIANGDKGNEGTIELSNNEVENIFRYKSYDLKGKNLTKLMPKLFADNHSKYMENYFKIGEKKLIDKNNFKSFGKDKFNSIIKIKLALKLFPILNDKVYFISLIIKENIDDIILLDEKFNIQGMSLKLMKILNISNENLFQNNEIPLYVICRKFVNFYTIFLKDKKRGDNEKQAQSNRDDIKKEESNEKQDIHENIEINENVELEYELKLPQFLIEFSEKTDKKNISPMQIISAHTESEMPNEIIEEYDENDLLVEDKKTNIINKDEEKNKKNPISTTSPTPTPMGQTPITISESDGESNIVNVEEKLKLNKQSEEEKIFNTKIEQYKSLFNEEKYESLEKLINKCNSNSSSVEYKFNFSFNKKAYGNKQVMYIVRCIDNKNDIGKSQEESIVDLDPKLAKYKKEKTESIKPLFELLEEEKKEIIELPENFIKLSSENKKFQKLLQLCKDDINVMSKAYGQKQDEVLEDENSSQSSQSSFDSGLVKKNRIEEIRSNLLSNISSFYTLKYIKLVMTFIGILTVTFSVVYLFFFTSLYSNLKKTSKLNVSLFQTTLWTTEIINIFICLRTLYLKEIVDPLIHKDYPSYFFNDYLTDGKNLSYYYEESVKKAYNLYDRLSDLNSDIEMEIPNYLTDAELRALYWNRMNISYNNPNYFKYSKRIDNESFPMAISQLLSNSITYLESNTFKSISEETKTNFESNIYSNLMYFNYMTYLIIENGYDNILHNQFNKLLTIPNILKNFNSSKIANIIGLVCVYGAIIIILYFFYSFLIHLTNKSMIDGMEKVTKIKIDKIEEIIKKIKIFNNNLKKFREKDTSTEENKEKGEGEEDNKNAEEGKMNSNDKLVNSNGFNIDFNKYIPLTILNYTHFHSLIMFLIIAICLIPIFIYSINMVNSTNQLFFVQNQIYGQLISSSTNMLEIKLFISECDNKTYLDFRRLVDMSLIEQVIKGVELFPKVEDFYYMKFLQDVCLAGINDTESEKFAYCKEDPLMISANNTDNVMKLIDDLIDSIIKEDEMNRDYKRNLYNTSLFRQIEYMHYKYVFDVGDNLEDAVTSGLNTYLFQKKIFIIIFISLLGLVIAIYCVIFGFILIRGLVHHLSVSRCIMKIIPTSVIIGTQELETWIENRY